MVGVVFRGGNDEAIFFICCNNAFDWMQANGGMSRANCERFRKYILSVGNSVDLKKAFQEFIGHDMQIEPYLRISGLSAKK